MIPASSQSREDDSTAGLFEGSFCFVFASALLFSPASAGALGSAALEMNAHTALLSSQY